MLPIEGGDGSTLSLDFTTGVLDPRLTFTRTTNATFINSQGLVQWADANMFRNTVWTSTSLPTGWLANPSNTGTITYNGDGTISCNASSQTAWIYPNFPYVETANGLSYICSVRVVSISASAAVNAIVSSGNLTALEYFIDGVSKLATDSVTGPCVVSVRVTASGTQWYPRLGAGVQGVNVSFNLVMSEPHAHPGVAPRAYMANTSTSAANFNTPRFDYDPSTLQPRGLLIEGSASNYGTYSESFATSGSGTLWTYSDITKNATLASSPSGSNDAAQFNETTVNTIHRISQFVTAAAGAVTISVWAKAIDPATPRRLYMNANGFMGCGALFDLDPAVQTGASGNAVNVAGTAANRAGTWVKYPNGWYRCSIVGTYNTAQTLYLQANRASSTVATDDTYAGSTANGLMLYGFQVELGSGASSYIPTGASQGSRNNDLLSMTGAGLSWFSNSYSEGTFYFRGAITNTPTGYTRLFCLTQSTNLGTATGTVPAINLGVAASNSNRPFLNAFVAANNDVDIYVPVGAAVTNGTEFGLAACYKAGDWRISSKNLAATSAFGSVGSTWGVNLFMSAVNGVPMPQLWYKQFRFYPTRLSNAQMDALSA